MGNCGKRRDNIDLTKTLNQRKNGNTIM